MPFVETCRMDERVRMLTDWDSGNWSVSELCRRYGVCRDTFYEWRARRAGGAAGWAVERSHAPHHCPHRSAAAVAEAVIALRRRWPHLGPRKLRALLAREAPATCWPAASTIGDILKRAGLVAPVRRRRRALDPAPQPYAAVSAANDEWATDFKGWFRTRDQCRIDPLTVSDSHSRLLIEVRITAPTCVGVQPVLRAAFEAHGLPRALRCDNGPPFGALGAGGLSRLSAWWLKLGIEVRFIRPGAPQDNGRHERMHRTLKAATSRPPAASAAEQQARFDAFRRHYNHERPHEALGQRPPAALYAPSPRALPARVADPWYDADHAVRRVHGNGEIRWRGRSIFIGEALAGELVGLAALESGDQVVRFCGHDLGLIERTGTFRRFAPPRPPRPPAAPPAPPTCRPSTRSNLSTIMPVEHPGAGRGSSRRASLDRERLLDQLVAARHLLGEDLVGGALGELEPGVELVLAHAGDLDARLLEGLRPAPRRDPWPPRRRSPRPSARRP